jgi:hypothetical protein
VAEVQPVSHAQQAEEHGAGSPAAASSDSQRDRVPDATAAQPLTKHRLDNPQQAVEAGEEGVPRSNHAPRIPRALRNDEVSQGPTRLHDATLPLVAGGSPRFPPPVTAVRHSYTEADPWFSRGTFRHAPGLPHPVGRGYAGIGIGTPGGDGMSDTPRFCDQCGAPQTPGVRFCEQCGNPQPDAGLVPPLDAASTGTLESGSASAAADLPAPATVEAADVPTLPVEPREPATLAPPPGTAPAMAIVAPAVPAAESAAEPVPPAATPVALPAQEAGDDTTPVPAGMQPPPDPWSGTAAANGGGVPPTQPWAPAQWSTPGSWAPPPPPPAPSYQTDPSTGQAAWGWAPPGTPQAMPPGAAVPMPPGVGQEYAGSSMAPQGQYAGWAAPGTMAPGAVPPPGWSGAPGPGYGGWAPPPAYGWAAQGAPAVRRSGSSVLAWILLVAAGVATAAGSFLPWIVANAFDQSGRLIATELGQLTQPPILGNATGYAVIAAGAIAGALGLVGLFARRIGRPVGVLALLAFVVAAAGIASAVPGILNEISRLTGTGQGFEVTFGIGFIVSAAGAAVGVLTAMWAAVASR